ncbi:hypothetical protein Tcan_10556 [Toxocara canis]|uniref:Uncharacterized protein n=1 Tax=Toxocara canis TaxID=6265 RepID=A0A0B2UWY1_TOXCA|nr:hypothetical protein Tcan_10556 [Toxocara canis]
MGSRAKIFTARVCIHLLVCVLCIVGDDPCDEKYEEKICSMNERERRAEAIRMSVINETMEELKTLDDELNEHYHTIANAPLLAAHPKFLAILTAGNDFPLRSYHGFNHLLHLSTFRSGLSQLAEKEFLALLSIESSFEQILHATRTLRADAHTMLTSITREKWLDWKAMIGEDYRKFEAQNAAAISAEAGLGDVIATFSEFKFALDNSNYAKLPIKVRRYMNYFVDQHKASLDAHMKLVQAIVQYVQRVVTTLKTMADMCPLDELRAFKTRYCTIHRAIVSRLLVMITELTNSYDAVMDRYVKKICASMPSVETVLPSQSMLESFKRVYGPIANVTRELDAHFQKKMEKLSSAKQQLLRDKACYQLIISAGGVRKYCNSKGQIQLRNVP